jgi:hypothetical protein
MYERKEKKIKEGLIVVIMQIDGKKSLSMGLADEVVKIWF